MLQPGLLQHYQRILMVVAAEWHRCSGALGGVAHPLEKLPAASKRIMHGPCRNRDSFRRWHHNNVCPKTAYDRAQARVSA